MNFLRTCAEMAGPVALAAWLPRAILPRLRRYRAITLAGLLVVFVAGGASMARFRPVSAIPLSELPLQLIATSVGATPDQSIALIADAERALPHLMREGNGFGHFPGVRLASIAAARVSIDDRGRIERLELRPRANQVAIAGGLFAEGDPVPVYEDGELAGIELQNLRPDGLYAQLGLRDGDRVAAINGVPFSAPDANGAILRALTESPHVELSVLRGDGTPARVTVPRDRLFEALRAFD